MDVAGYLRMRRDSARSKNAAEVAGMRSIFQPRLVNGPFADPALFVDVLFERRATWTCEGALASEVRAAFLGVTP